MARSSSDPTGTKGASVKAKRQRVQPMELVPRPRTSDSDPGITVFVEVRLSVQDEQRLSQFEQAISGYPEVIECFLMTGDADYLLQVHAADVRSFHQFLDETLRRINYVLTTKSSVAIRQVKRRSVASARAAR